MHNDPFNEIRAQLEHVAGLLSECASRVRALADLPDADIPIELEALLTDLAATLDSKEPSNEH